MPAGMKIWEIEQNSLIELLSKYSYAFEDVVFTLNGNILYADGDPIEYWRVRFRGQDYVQVRYKNKLYLCKFYDLVDYKGIGKKNKVKFKYNKYLKDISYQEENINQSDTKAIIKDEFDNHTTVKNKFKSRYDQQIDAIERKYNNNVYYSFYTEKTNDYFRVSGSFYGQAIGAEILQDDLRISIEIYRSTDVITWGTGSVDFSQRFYAAEIDNGLMYRIINNSEGGLINMYIENMKNQAFESQSINL